MDMDSKQAVDQIKGRSDLRVATEHLEENTDGNTRVVHKLFGLDRDETLQESFSAALALKILVHGRLYITNKRLCFHSHFNAKTLFFKDTRIVVPFEDIESAEACMNALIFNNSIKVHLKNGKSKFFTSFLFRDRAL